MVNPNRRSVLAGGLLGGASALALTACSNSSSSNSSGGATAQADFEARGPITFATGKDTSGKLQSFIDNWNAEHPEETVTLVELPESADEQRNMFINNAQSQSDAYTVLGLDVVWTAEFAAQQWVVELPEDKFPLSELIPATVETGRYFERLYAVPFTSNAELLFYRTDLLEAAGITAPPNDFAEMYEQIEKIRATDIGKDTLGFASQYSKYEGLTVQLTALAGSAGGALFSDDGTPQATSPEVLAGVQVVRDGFDQNYIPQEALTYTEEPGRQAFQDGKLAFLQNWPYVWDLAQQEDGSSQVAGKVAIAQIPGVDGNPGTSTLGGLNYGISAFGKNLGTAADFIAFMVSAENQKEWTLATSQAPSNQAIYEDAEVVEKFPFFPDLKAAIDAGVSRPQVVKYGEVTQAVQDAGYNIFSGATEVEAGLEKLQSDLEAIDK